MYLKGTKLLTSSLLQGNQSLSTDWEPTSDKRKGIESPYHWKCNSSFGCWIHWRIFSLFVSSLCPRGKCFSPIDITARRFEEWREREVQKVASGVKCSGECSISINRERKEGRHAPSSNQCSTPQEEMKVHYKFTYFYIRGRGEPIRSAFSYNRIFHGIMTWRMSSYSECSSIWQEFNSKTREFNWRNGRSSRAVSQFLFSLHSNPLQTLRSDLSLCSNSIIRNLDRVRQSWDISRHDSVKHRSPSTITVSLPYPLRSLWSNSSGGGSSRCIRWLYRWFHECHQWISSGCVRSSTWSQGHSYSIFSSLRTYLNKSIATRQNLEKQVPLLFIQKIFLIFRLTCSTRERKE